MADLSIDEANKIRLSMGLPALPGGSASAMPAAPSGLDFKPAKDGDGSDEEPASTIDTRQAAASDNWKKLEEERLAKIRREERAAAIKKEREKAARFAKLEGKGLADEADVDDDMAWLKSSKKRQKKIAKEEQMRKELEERERQALEAMQYTDKDLAGVKVGHEVDQFDDEDQILVLKDTAVDGEDEDELEAVSLREKERLQERLDSKKRKRAYDPNDMDESGQKSILAQYDEEIEGKKNKAFTLDGKGRTVEDVQAEVQGASRPKKVAISLDILKDDAPTNDYMDVSEVKMKKPKKKKSKKSKRERVEDDEEMLAMPAEDPVADDMDLDGGETSAPQQKKKKVFDESFVDDDDLQANLAAQRQKALKKRKKMRPEDLARQMREEASTPQPDVVDSTEDGDGALVIDETTEFVQNLGNGGDAEEEEARRKRRRSSHVSEGTKSMGDIPVADEDGDVEMGQSYAEAAEAEEARNRSVSRARSTDITETGLEAEKTVDQGLGATLALLKQRGLVTESDASDKNTMFRERQKFLADKLKAEAEAERQRKIARERERGSARWNNMTPREREEWARKNNTSADMVESRRLAELFNKEYTPNVELKYVDEHGRQMNQKEAFKQLSHQFHGKGSGNTKTKKHLDKVAAEKKKMAESSLEASRSGGGGLGNAFDDQAKKKGTAGVRLQ
ncbi:dna binding protein sart-1 [Stemphylium lycopersici]|uniref:Dna binding protein sart-1 n=1 Tax=Stemphylium lycopersici TaxID=183478 RepID=A0A364N2F0_STELY|nr:dna binding protein sart-1 [Stemphylium lycopersici]RAR09463.1 dna binding protein sart-1 [Stemphylium lycopersici]